MQIKIKPKYVFEIYKDRKKHWRFRLKATNGKIIASGEGYTRKQNLMKAVEILINLSYENSTIRKL